MRVEGEQRIRLTAVSFSLVLHLILFWQITNIFIGSQAQATHFLPSISVDIVKSDTQASVPAVKHEPLPEVATLQEAAPKPDQTQVTQTEQTEPPKQTASSNIEDHIHYTQDRIIPRKDEYMSRLAAYIEGHKYYPRMARSRGISGNIEVSFDLLHNGEIAGLKTLGGSSVLRQAAEKAVTSALPLPMPSADMHFPLQVSYVMQFVLQ